MVPLLMLIITILVGALLCGAIGGTVIMLASKPITQKEATFPAGFRIAAAGALLYWVFAILLGLIPGLALAGGALAFVFGIVALMFLIERELKADRMRALALAAMVVVTYAVCWIVYVLLTRAEGGILSGRVGPGFSGTGAVPFMMP